MNVGYFSDSNLDQMLSKAKLVIFDLNGTIVDDEPVQLESFRQALHRFDVNITEEFWIQKCVGRTTVDIIKDILDTKGIAPSDYSMDEVYVDKKRIYGNLIQSQLPIIIRDGIQDFISYLSNKQYNLALGTSASRSGMEQIIGGLGLKGIFSNIVCGDDVMQNKPAPEVYLKASNGIPVNYCLVIEDSSIGVTSAVNAGMPVLAVPNKFTENQDLSSADYILNNITRNAQIIQYRN